jgi:hypothetical protein
MPELASVPEVELVPGISQYFTQAGIVKQEPAFLINDEERGGT